MPWYLRHFFDPDFDHTALKPRPLARGRCDMRNLGYARNVLPGQVLAELTPLAPAGGESGAEIDPRFILDAPVLPAGRHTAPDPRHPLRLLATAAGYVYREEGLIAVKTLLNVRGGVDFHTGNIAFVGKVHIHRDVGSGFTVRGTEVLVDGGVFGGRVRARGDLAVQGGARGDNANCLLSAGRNLRIGFADKAELRAGNDLDIDQALHSALLAGGGIVVRRNLNGGVCRARRALAVGGDLGHASLAPTLVILGDDPAWSRPLRRCSERLDKARRTVDQCAPLAGHLPPDANDCARRLARARREAHILEKQRAFLQAGLERARERQRPSRLVVTGCVHPGVRLVLDGAILDVESPIRGARFERRGDEVIVLPPGAETARPLCPGHPAYSRPSGRPS